MPGIGGGATGGAMPSSMAAAPAVDLAEHCARVLRAGGIDRLGIARRSP
jgi:hypothetical protein